MPDYKGKERRKEPRQKCSFSARIRPDKVPDLRTNLVFRKGTKFVCELKSYEKVYGIQNNHIITSLRVIPLNGR